jgi:hypothetical protein
MRLLVFEKYLKLKAQDNLLPSARVARGATAAFIKSIASTPLGLLYKEIEINNRI